MIPIFFFLAILTTTCFADSSLVLSTFVGSPYSNQQKTGFYDLILQEAFSRIGRKIDIEHLPAERSITNANLGLHGRGLCSSARP